MEKKWLLLTFLLFQVLKIEASSSSFNANFGFDYSITKGDSPVTVGPVIPAPPAIPPGKRNPATVSDRNPAAVSDQNSQICDSPVSALAQNPATVSDQNPQITDSPISAPAQNSTADSNQNPPISDPSISTPARNPVTAPDQNPQISDAPVPAPVQTLSPNPSANLGSDFGSRGDSPVTIGPVIPAPPATPSQPGNPATVSDQNPPISAAESALQAWKSAITDDPLHFLDNWVGPDVCSYKGIFCFPDNESSSSPTIASIDLNKANLKGTLVKELSFFKNMTIFHLNSNRFTGLIPDSFENLTCLEELDLSNNNFSGPFPKVALCIPNLAYLDLRFNCFSGPIPETLFNKKLDAIFINNNNFDGLIPQNLGNSVASVINFANNRLTGSLPTNFGQFGCEINEIVLLNNQLTGCMPPGIGLFPDLEVFDVGQNSFTGQIPDTLAQLKKIEVLNLGNNKFSGQMPDFCSIKSLQNLTVSNNFFSGFGPDCSLLLKNKVGFNFSLNCVPGSIWGTPRSQCSIIPGESLNCLRLPVPPPLACAAHKLVSGTSQLVSNTSHGLVSSTTHGLVSSTTHEFASSATHNLVSNTTDLVSGTVQGVL